MAATPRLGALVLGLFLVGCREKTDDTPSDTGTVGTGASADTSTVGRSPAEIIAGLEAKDLLPTLDRGPTLAGIDDDANGVRDDVDAYVGAHFSASSAGALQLARALQQTVLTDPQDPLAVSDAAGALSRAVACLADSPAVDAPAAAVVDTLEAITANTEGRLLAYLAVDAQLDGSWSPDPGIDACDVAPVTAPLQAEASPPCTSRVVYFNGLWARFVQAESDRSALRALVGDEGPNGEPLNYAMFFGSSSDALAALRATFAEGLAAGEEGVLDGRYELFFEALHGGGPWWTAIEQALPSFAPFIGTDVPAQVAQAAGDALAAAVTEPPQLANYARLQARLDDWTGSHLVFVGHSRGNLFGLAARAYLDSVGRGGEAVQLHVAPVTDPSPDAYVLTDIDLVSTELLGASLAPNAPATDTASALGDPLGHDFQRVYLGDPTVSLLLKDTATQSFLAFPPAVFFVDSLGVQQDLSATFAAGTETNPIIVPLTTAGDLYVCQGTWYASVVVQADVGIHGSASRDTSILDGGGFRSTVNVESSRIVSVADLTLSRGWLGAGTFSAVTVDNVRFDGKKQRIASYGGTVFAACRSTVTIEHSDLQDAIAGEGGLVYAGGATLIFDDVIFSGGASESWGGAMSVASANTCGDPIGTTIVCSDCGFYGNSALKGGALHMSGGSSLDMAPGPLMRAEFSGNTAALADVNGTLLMYGSTLGMPNTLGGPTATFTGTTFGDADAAFNFGRWGDALGSQFMQPNGTDIECAVIESYPADLVCGPATRLP